MFKANTILHIDSVIGEYFVMTVYQNKDTIYSGTVDVMSLNDYMFYAPYIKIRAVSNIFVEPTLKERLLNVFNL